MKQSIIRLVKKILNTFGVEIHKKGVGVRRITMAGVLNHVSRLGFSPQTVIDIGVADGTFDLYESFPDANHLLVEPLKEFEKTIKKISKKYKVEYIIVAAGAKLGNVVINVHPDLVGSSILKETEDSDVNGIPREVPIVTIDSLCDERNLKGPYVLKVDVQGTELDVLDGAKKVLKDTEVIILEVSFFQSLVGGPQFYDVVNYMKDHKFVAYDIFGGHNRPYDDALAQVDLVFVKEDGRFREHHFYATREQRKQLTKRLRPLLGSK